MLHDVIRGGIPVKGYYHWSLHDNFEWADGYKIPFGLYRVDKETKARTPTESAEVYGKIAKGNVLPE